MPTPTANERPRCNQAEGKGRPRRLLKGRSVQAKMSQEADSESRTVWELMGLPRGATKDTEASNNVDHTSTRPHANGNGFHIPSVMMVLALMLSTYNMSAV